MQRSINWMNYKFIKWDGYGRYGTSMIRALMRCGVDVYPALRDLMDLPGWMQRSMGLNFDKLTVQLMPAHNFVRLPGHSWGYTMIESDRPPKGWAKQINETVDRLLVPCEQNAEAFKKGGVRVPIHVVHGGTDPEEFPMLPVVKRDRPYTFLCLGDRGSRKGVEKVWSAFFKGFEGVKDVRLVIKTRAGGMMGIGNLTFPDKRLTIWKEDLESLSSVYEYADCFVFPSYAEGWGMPPREAAMMGLPVIATRYSGLEVGLDGWAIPLEKFVMQQAQAGAEGIDLDGAQWAVPDLDELIEKMRWCYENREMAVGVGQRSAAWLRRFQTWEHSAGQFMELVEKYLCPTTN
jgi:glycosyltransferase involved in cell wall biosynthesis